MGRIPFFIGEAFRALRRSAAPSIAAVVTIVVTTLLLGVLVPVLDASEKKTSDVRDAIGLNVFLVEGSSEQQISTVGSKIERLEHVDAVEYVSPEEGLASLKGRLSDDDVLKELKTNPIPPAFRVDIDDPESLGEVSAAIAGTQGGGKANPLSPAIDEVNDARDDGRDITKVTGALQIVLIVLAALLLVASLLLVANTIRLSIYARRREVEVMRLVGATNWFIRWPFIIEGVLVGLMGAAIAVGILWAGKVVVLDPLASSFALVDNLQTVPFERLVAILVTAAVVVSALGSGLTLRRFLRV